MQIIGFNLTKIAAERKPNYNGNIVIGTNIEFPKVEKAKVELLKDSDAYKIDFEFKVFYDQKQEDKKDKKENLAEISFEGHILLAIGADDPKELHKALKKSDLPISLKEGFLNLLLRKCTARALELEDQLGIAFHMPFPKVKLEEKK